MKLTVKGGYSSSAAGPFKAGDEVHVSDSLGEFLLRDSPGTFERADAPPPQDPAGEPGAATKGVNRQMTGGRAR